ncbi:putative F-box protein At3g16210 [Trifolium pratense]|uniref:putative F-box protein At3g16210 n=1 Tax=Trifolium pratense TaxID=57577 RepID=UPI001E691B55|nr:putative F-box protein At3g16210 [Trifolium pratense]
MDAILWNPYTKEFKVIPHNPLYYYDPYKNFDVDFLRFGYDPVKDDYKVLRHGKLSTNCLIWEIYSLRNNSWRKLDVYMHHNHHFRYRNQVNMDGVSHW